MNQDSALDLHAASIVIDGVCPLAGEPAYLEWYREGGVSGLAPSLDGTANARAILDVLATWQRHFRERPDILPVHRATDLERAKQTGQLGVYFHLQGTEPIEDNLDLVDLYKTLGVGVVQLTYNVRNRVGDGCEEPTNICLSRFGAKLVERLNQARVIVDCSHTGLRTALDAVRISSAPVVLSHSNLASVHPSARNVADELVDAIARSGGIVGLAGFPAMVAPDARPTLDQFIAHLDAIVRRVGIEHVGLGLDYYSLQAGVASDEAALCGYRDALAAGVWGPAYPPPPHHYPAGIETPKALPNLTRRMLARGYSDADVRKILGENWLRVMRAVWGS